jgi:peroxiredoxin
MDVSCWVLEYRLLRVGVVRNVDSQRILEVTIMNRHIISIIVVLAVLAGTCAALAQDSERTGPEQSQLEMRQRFRDMSQAERDKLQADMRQAKERWQNMSEADREKFRAEMRERFGRAPGLGHEEQLRAIKAIEDQLAKLKAVTESMAPENRGGFRDLSEEERTALRQRMMAASRERQMAMRAIEGELARLRGRRRPESDPREQIGELRAIHKLAVKENATQTADRLEKLIASFRGDSRARGPRPELRPRGDLQRPRPERPPRPDRADRPDRTDRPDTDSRAKPFTLESFDGQRINLADYRGKTVVLEWLNFECPFSRYHYETTTTMVDLAKKYKDQNVIWLAINSTNHTTPEANKAFAARHKLPFPILDDRPGTVGRAYDAKTTPHMFVISPRGQIVYEGAIDNSPMGKTPDGKEPVNYVDRVLAALTANKDIGIPNTKPYGCSVKYAK